MFFANIELLIHTVHVNFDESIYYKNDELAFRPMYAVTYGTNDICTNVEYVNW